MAQESSSSAQETPATSDACEGGDLHRRSGGEHDAALRRRDDVRLANQRPQKSEALSWQLP